MKNKKVGEIVAADFATAEVFNELGIDFCCHGSHTLQDACTEKGLNVENVIRELENVQASHSSSQGKNFAEWPLDLVVDYVLKVHHRNFHKNHGALLTLVKKVASVHGDHHPELKEVAYLVEDSFAELAQHFRKEEMVLFPHLYDMWSAHEHGQPMPPFHCGSVGAPISQMMLEHEDAGETWMHLEQITEGFTTPADGCMSYRLMNEKLHQFYTDLLEHVHLENNIIFPGFMAIEEE